MRVLLNVGNEIAPGAHLCANIEELRDNREKEVGIAEQIAEMSAVAGLILVLAVNRGKFRAQDKHRPDQGNRADDEIGLHDAQRFRTKVCLVSVTCLLCGDFLRRQLDTGKNKDRANQGAANRTQWIEGLREVQPPFRTMGVAELSDERIGRGLQE